MTSPDGITWTARSAPVGTTDSTWKSVTYGNGTFVAVANVGTTKVMTSPDGETWTAQTPAEDNSWESVTFGNGTFVAVADTGTNRVMTSPDGVTWTARADAGTDLVWRAVTYGTGTFVAINDRENAMTSADGASWSLHSTDSRASWTGLTYGNGLFVAVAGNSFINTSPDGATWTRRSYPSGFNAGLSAVAYGGDTFVAVPSLTAGKVIVSSDGMTWSIQDAVSGSGWSGITYGNNRFVAVGGSTARVITGTTVPTVTTQAASAVSATSVTGNGTITSEGTASSTARGFVYGASTSYGATTTESGTFGAGAFTASITGLTCGTTYHYAAYATNTFGTGYASDTTFTTSQCPAEDEEDSESDSPRSSISGGGTSVMDRVKNLLASGNTAFAQQLMREYPQAFSSAQTAAAASAAVTPATGPCPSYRFTRSLQQGMTGEDVRELQKFLNCQGFAVSAAGAGSRGNESNVFAARTHEAVVAFQQHYAAEILAPAGVSGATGVFGEFSIAKAHALMDW